MSTGRLTAFALTKWYLDCVAPDGRALVAYWASLAWRGVVVRWHAVSVHEPGRPPRRRAALAHAGGAAPPPALDADTLAWRAPALGLAYDARATQPAVSATLLDSPRGAVEWTCVAPAARVRATLRGAAPVEGTGYVERLALTLPPWRLPIRELRWGRWISDDAARSLVWIDWRGPAPRRWVFLDARETPDATVDDARVVVGGASLALRDPVPLDAQALRRACGRVPALGALAPPSLRRWRDTRWCSAGTLDAPGRGAVSGRAVHELVVLPEMASGRAVRATAGAER